MAFPLERWCASRALRRPHGNERCLPIRFVAIHNLMVKTILANRGLMRVTSRTESIGAVPEHLERIAQPLLGFFVVVFPSVASYSRPLPLPHRAEPCPWNPRPLPRQQRGPAEPPAAGWVVVGKPGRGPAGPVTVTGAVRKAVEFVGKAGIRHVSPVASLPLCIVYTNFIENKAIFC